MVASLRKAGMSTRAIAAATGMDQRTVRRDLGGGEANAAPEPVTGLDGKSYSPRHPVDAISADQLAELNVRPGPL